MDKNRLIKLALPEWKPLALGTLFLFIGSLSSLLYPQAVRVVIDSTLVAGGDPKMIDKAVLFMAIIFVIQGVAIAFRYYLFTVSGEKIVARLRGNLYGNLMKQEIAFFDGKQTGEPTNRLASDTTVLQNTVSVNISLALRHLASVIGGVGFLFYTSVSLTLLILVIVPPVAIGAVFFGRRIRKFSEKVQDALAAASHVAEETLSGIRTVRIFSQEEGEIDRYERKIDDSFQLAKARTRFTSFFTAVVTTAGYGAVAVVFWYGGHLVLDKAITVGDLTSFLLYTLIVAFSLSSLAALWADFMRASGAAERIFTLIDRKPQMDFSEGKSIPNLQGQIAFRNISFAYPSRPDIPVLEDVSFTIEPGEVVALVGPSGGGKSTIASLLTRLYDPTSGTITLDGFPLTDLDAKWMREQIGKVSQEPILFSTSIAGNISYGKEQASPAEIESAAQMANAHEFVIGFPEKYETLVGERGVLLSGGQKQRVAIARAVLKDPSILILDEATSALDSKSESLVKEALDRLMENRTTLVIAHRLSTVKGASRVLVIEQGRIVQSGTHKELVDQEGTYRKLLEYQLMDG